MTTSTSPASTPSARIRAGDAPAAVYEPGQRLDGFVVSSVTPLPNLRAIAYQIEHEASGARILHVHSSDSENLFSVSFPTPPPDDTGVPHILEHAVLGGSKRFPVKEPFFEMIKMSMATFINAMTDDLHTMYPVASNVRRDYFNLAEVYWDAVFHPQLEEDTFKREGHHFTLADTADPSSALRVKGIVYNEMKGAYSNPETRVWWESTRALFPDTPLGRDSGGNPASIPDLTFEGFKGFHERYYQPGNAYIFLYGDIPTAEHLAFLGSRLEALTSRGGTPEVPRQPRWTQPRRERRGYPIEPAEDTAGKTYLTLSWVTGDATDPIDATAWGVLDRILLGNEAAPLKKALIDSKLGADLFASGAGSSGAEATFRVGLKGSEADRADAFEALVLESLGRIAGEGMPRNRVEAAFQQLAYHHLEIQTLFPLRLMQAAHAGWLFGKDPLAFLRMDKHLAEAHRRYDTDPAIFSRMIQEQLLSNPHRLLSVFAPDREMQARLDAAFDERMKKERTRFSEDDLAGIGRAAAALEALQGKPNPPEAIALLPQLRVGDLPRKPRHIPTSVETLAGGIELLRNEVFSNGVNYLQIAVDIAGLPTELYPYLPRYGDAFAKLGAAGQPFTRIAERRSACTGGMSFGDGFVTHAADPRPTLRHAFFGLKTLNAQVEPALALLHDVVFGLDPRDKDRLRDVQKQARAWYRTTLVSDGSNTALRHAARGLSPESFMGERVHGLPVLPMIERYSEAFDANADELIQRIEAIRDFLITRGRWVVSFTGSDEAYATLRRELDRWSGEMRGRSAGGGQAAPALPFEPYAKPPREGLAGPMAVAYCAAVMPAPHGSHPDAPLLELGGRFMSLDYVLNEIRFKGNAYGGGCYYSESDRTFSFYSYRDPRLAETLAAFRGLKGYVAAANWSQLEIDRAIIGSAKHAERPIRPGEATSTALRRRLRGDTPERREERYARLLAATPAEVKRVLLEQLETNEPRAAVCVVSSRERLEEANRQMPGEELVIEDILKT